MMPKTCDGVQLKPGQIGDIETQLQCIRKAMRGAGQSISPTRKQCTDTIDKLQPLLVAQLRALESASGAPSIVAQTVTGAINYPLVVSQMEALKMKVFSPSGFVRPECPNPEALQDYLSFPQRGGQLDICVDLGFCSAEQSHVQSEYVHALVSQNALWLGTDPIKTSSKIRPPGIDDPKEAKETAAAVKGVEGKGGARNEKEAGRGQGKTIKAKA